jgi:hypothetical protein
VLDLAPLVDRQAHLPQPLSKETREYLTNSVVERLMNLESEIIRSSGKNAPLKGLKASWMIVLSRLITRGLQVLPYLPQEGTVVEETEMDTQGIQRAIS